MTSSQLSPNEPEPVDPRTEQLATLERMVAATPDLYLVRVVVTAAVRAKSQEQATRRQAEIVARQGFFVERAL